MDQINFTRDYMNDAIRGMSVTWRNRDMERLLDQNTIDHLSSIAIQTPRKQSNKYFNVFSITNQELILKLYPYTAVPEDDRPQPYNPQIIAPLLLVWMSCDLELGELSKNYLINDEKQQGNDVLIDTHQAVGISAGVVAYEANQMGLATGFCRCISSNGVKKELETYGINFNSTDKVLLTLSIGYSLFHDPRQHQLIEGFYFEPHNKVDAGLIYIV